jgi:hypothetical protein
MVRPPRRKLVDATFWCLEEDDFTFPGKMEYVGLEVEEPGGGIRWEQGQDRASCPHDPLHRFKLVEVVGRI